jgi:hypothetical protein
LDDGHLVLLGPANLIVDSSHAGNNPCLVNLRVRLVPYLSLGVLTRRSQSKSSKKCSSQKCATRAPPAATWRHLAGQMPEVGPDVGGHWKLAGRYS